MAGILLLFGLAAVTCQDLVVGAPFQSAIVLDMAKILLDNYCLPENLLGMQEAIQQAINSGEILHISDRKTLASVLTSGVQGALNDPRLTVWYEPNYIPVLPPALSSLPTEQLIRLIRSSVKLEIMENNIGYLRIDRIIGQETVVKLGRFLHDNIWKKVAHTSEMIFDLRFSTAGEMSGVPYIVSYFSNSEPLRHIDTIYERPSNSTKEIWTLPTLFGDRYGKRKEVVVLISKRTSGAAEAVAYILKQIKRATIVGEKSAGGSVKVEQIRVRDSGFYITVPVARSINPISGQSWEVSGVTPSLSINPKESIAKAKSLLAVRKTIPKAVKNLSDIIKRFYSSRDRTAFLPSHLAKADFSTVFSEEDLTAKLNYELQGVFEDPRLTIKTKQDSSDLAKNSPKLTVASREKTLLKSTVNALFKMEILSGNVGYLRLDRFPTPETLIGLESQIKEKIWQPLQNTESLIIDLRHNSGGSSEALPILLSFLYDNSSNIHLYSIYDSIRNVTVDLHTLSNVSGPFYSSRKGIYVLTSYFTAEAGEEFAYLTQSLHRGTVIGEITSGILHHSRTFPVQGTSLEITIPIINFIDVNGEYHSVVDYESLASQLTTDLREASHDHRLHIFYCEIEQEALQDVPQMPSPEEIRFIIEALFTVEVMPGNTGYLRFDMMEDKQVMLAIEPQFVTEVWNKLVNTDRLVIDMRYNTGGYSTAIPLLCTYFFAPQSLRHLYSIFDRATENTTKVMTLPQVLGQRYRSGKDVFILTSHLTGSAAEAFTRTMKDLDRATVIGEPTIGGALSSGTYQIGKRILYASIPNQAVLSAVSGKAWSVSGVAPHIASQASEALHAAQKLIAARNQKKMSEKNKKSA